MNADRKLTKLTALWPPFSTSYGAAPPARTVPSTLIAKAKRLGNEPDPKRTRIVNR